MTLTELNAQVGDIDDFSMGWDAEAFEVILPTVWPCLAFDCPVCGPDHRIIVWWSDLAGQDAPGLGPALHRTAGSSEADFTFADVVSADCGLSGTIQNGAWVPTT